jgi:iron only hydrogenase large subunit-like protein/uncharacterized Fe-S cluster-containing protein
MSSEIVFTRKAKCRDCHRCVRACPVKAIRVIDGQAQVVAERCIGCGTCIRECPQHAKAYRNDVTDATAIVADSPFVVASVAPSYAAIYEPWKRKRLPSALRRLGFRYVAETAAAAQLVAQVGAAYVEQHPEQSYVWSSCPAVTEYVRKYRPEMASMLMPIASPMVAHARWLRARLGPDVKVVFIGPCVAKKAEAERPECDDVDLVLTFEELTDWLQDENICLSSCEESEFDEIGAGARLYPLPDGALRTAGLAAGGALANDLGAKAFSADGFADVDRALDLLAESTEPRILESLFCSGGCINGPAAATKRNVFSRRFDLEEAAASAVRSAASGATIAHPAAPTASLFDGAIRTPTPVLRPVSASAINKALAATGKTGPEDQLDCGACGYATCRDKAIAVVRGMAEPEMCIPYMRHLAETRTDLILDASPNGILTVDPHFIIMAMNPAFRKHFRAGEATLGKNISVLMDPEPFVRLATTDEEHIEMTVRHERYGVTFHQLLFKLPEADQYVGIFVDITANEKDQRELEQMRTQTVQQAQELLDHQIAIAQQLAEFLGESTARGEVLVQNLLAMAGETRDATGAGAGAATANDPIKKWRWTTSTSK